MITAVGVAKDFRLPRGRLGRAGPSFRAVDDLSVSVGSGQVLGIVGPPGAGRTTTGLILTGRLAPDAGSVTYRDADLYGLGRRDRVSVLDELAMVRPGSDDLPARRTAREVLGGALSAGAARWGEEAQPDADDLLRDVGLDVSLLDTRVSRLTSAQRVLLELARVLALRPALVVLDEPVVPMPADQHARIVERVLRLRDEVGTAVVVLREQLADLPACDHVLVMYLGRVMEALDSGDLPDAAQHPYTLALLAHDHPDPSAPELLKGETPPPGRAPTGCVFRTRCFRAQDRCAEEVPELSRPLGSTHPVACHFPERVPPGSSRATGPAAPGRRSDAVSGGGSLEPTAREFAED